MTKDMRKHFGWFFYWLRVSKGLSYRKLSELSGISQPMLFSYEQDEEPRMYDSSYGKLAKALGLTLDQFDAWKVTAVKKPPPRRTRRGATKRSDLPDDPTARAVHVLHGVARSHADARLAIAMHLSHAECRAIRDALAARLKKPDVAKGKRQPDLLPIILEGRANNP